MFAEECGWISEMSPENLLIVLNEFKNNYVPGHHIEMLQWLLIDEFTARKKSKRQTRGIVTKVYKIVIRIFYAYNKLSLRLAQIRLSNAYIFFPNIDSFTKSDNQFFIVNIIF